MAKFCGVAVAARFVYIVNVPRNFPGRKAAYQRDGGRFSARLAKRRRKIAEVSIICAQKTTGVIFMNDDKNTGAPSPSPESIRRSYLLFLPVIAFMYLISALFLR